MLLAGCAMGPQKPLSTDTVESSPENNTKDKATLRAETAVDQFKIAITEINNNNLGNAKTILLSISKKQPDLAGPWANLALINMKQENYSKAEALINIALDKNPKMAQALNIAGYLENRKGNILMAKEYYEKAIEQKPDYALAHYNLALLYDVYFQDIKQAVTHYQLYLSQLGHEDKRTLNWVEELKLNLHDGDV